MTRRHQFISENRVEKIDTQERIVRDEIGLMRLVAFRVRPIMLIWPDGLLEGKAGGVIVSDHRFRWMKISPPVSKSS